MKRKREWQMGGTLVAAIVGRLGAPFPGLPVPRPAGTVINSRIMCSF